MHNGCVDGCEHGNLVIETAGERWYAPDRASPKANEAC